MLVLLSANLRAQVSGLTFTTSSLYAVYNTNATVTLATVSPAQGFIVLLTCPDSRGNFKSGSVRLKGGQRDTKIVYNIHVRAPLNSMFAAKIHRVRQLGPHFGLQVNIIGHQKLIYLRCMESAMAILFTNKL